MTHVDQDPARPEGSGAPPPPTADATLLVVALVELRTTYPVSELLGRTVINEAGEEVGRIDELMIEDDRLAFAVLSVGGFLGIGERKVVVSFDDLLIDDDEVVLPGATREALMEMTDYDPDRVRQEAVRCASRGEAGRTRARSSPPPPASRFPAWSPTWRTETCEQRPQASRVTRAHCPASRTCHMSAQWKALKSTAAAPSPPSGWPPPPTPGRRRRTS